MDSFMNAYFTLYYSKYVKGSQEKFKAMILLQNIGIIVCLHLLY